MHVMYCNAVTLLRLQYKKPNIRLFICKLKENGSQIFRGGVFHWLMITRWVLSDDGLKPPVAPVARHKVAASSSTKCWKLWPSSENYWASSRQESRAVTPPVWPWFDAQLGVADVGTQQQTLVWPGCQRTIGRLLLDTDMARRWFGRWTFCTTTRVR